MSDHHRPNRPEAEAAPPPAPPASRLIAPNPELGAAGGYLLAVDATTLTSEFTTVAVLSTTPWTISYDFTSPSGNTPEANGNALLLWQGEEASFDPARHPPSTPVPGSASQGEPTWALTTGLQALSYVVAYTTDGAAATTVATACITPDGAPGDTFSSTIKINSITTGSVVVDYSFPPGYRPASFHNRLGLYEGQQGAYDLPADGLITPFTRDPNSGSIAINYPFLRASWYTLVYFAGARDDDAAGFLRFQTKG